MKSSRTFAIGWVVTSILVVGILSRAAATVATLEDFYGDTGRRFQAALSFYNREPFSSTINPNTSSYGIGVDDMFISWKETRLDEDTTDCTNGGVCADIEVHTFTAYDGNSLVEITVIDKTPYDAANPRNDCDRNGSYADAQDDQDCNDNGTADVTVHVTSTADVVGEVGILDRIAAGSPVYRGRVPYSTTYDSPGSVFLQGDGTKLPNVKASYEDRNDGTGSRCRNALDPAQQGFVRTNMVVAIVAGRITLKGYHLALAPSTPGDDDGFADANETLDLALTLTNDSGLDLDDVVATLGSSDTTVACISRPFVAIGPVAAGATFVTPSFRFKVRGPPDVDRTTLEQSLRAAFTVTLRSNRFDALTRALGLALELDLNASGGGAPSPFLEDFEGVGLGLFTLESLDAGRSSLQLSDGFRCQYNDPFGANTNSANRADCFLGFAADPASGINDWHVQRHDSANCNSGRSYTGVQSLRWGTCPSTATSPVRDTTRLKQLDAVRTIDPINLPFTTANPELRFKHQASLADRRLVSNVQEGETVDRGVVQLQLADASGGPVGSWIKIAAYENDYDQQGTNDFSNCTFDPVDDGNDEDDFFEPLDPLRYLGPSSTCFPEFAFARSGDTDWRLDFNVANVGLAEGPGLMGNPGAGFRNPGTWVQPRFSLQEFAARRVRIRFLATSIELGTAQTWDELVAVDNVASDDGWFIDDVRVDAALTSPLTLAIDTASFAGASCPTCTSIVPILAATPTPPLAGPGQIVTLTARDSTIDVCSGGVAQYQFWIDANGNGIVGDPGDSLLRDWTDDASLIDAPQATTRYGVVVRCSTATGCDAGPGDDPGNAAVLVVTVHCPSTGNARAPFPQVMAVDRTRVDWPALATVDVVRGDLIALRSSGGNFNGTVAACLGGNDVTGTQVLDGTSPGPGGGFYYLVRPTTVAFCNQTPGYTTNHNREVPGRDAEIAGDPDACP